MRPKPRKREIYVCSTVKPHSRTVRFSLNNSNEELRQYNRGAPSVETLDRALNLDRKGAVKLT